MKKFNSFNKVDKFGIQLLIAFCLGLLVILTGLAVSAAEWFSKPIQCATVQEVVDLMEERDQQPLVAGVGTSRIGNEKIAIPTYIFVNTDEGSWHVIEFNIQSDQACVIAVGDQLDFEAVEWYYKQNDKT